MVTLKKKKSEEKRAQVTDIPSQRDSSVLVAVQGWTMGTKMGSFSEIKTPGNTQGPGADKRENDQEKKSALRV